MKIQLPTINEANDKMIKTEGEICQGSGGAVEHPTMRRKKRQSENFLCGCGLQGLIKKLNKKGT